MTEATPEDVREQSDDPEPAVDLPLEADPLDAADQAVVVEIDEDEVR